MYNNTKMGLPNQKIQSSPFVTNKMLATPKFRNPAVKDLALLKKGIWLYFFLLLFEGALRKWVLPELSNPLLIVRDPVAIWIMIVANKRGLLKYNSYLLSFTIITIISILTALVVGHGNFFVAIYGARIYLIHFPLIFIIGNVFTKDDVLKMGRMLLYISIPMTVLIALQFYSPQSAWVNKGVGADSEGGGFDGANGFFRPPATFSFITGTSSFFGMVASFLVYFWLNAKLVKKPVLIVASVCLLAAIPLTISRSLFFEVVLSLAFALVVVSRKPKFLVKILPIAIFSVVALAILSQVGLFQTATGAFNARFDTANEQEGGLQGVIMDRFLGGMLSALSGSSDIPFFGYGLGMGTNVGSMLISGKVTYLIAEAEWGRMIGEMGAILGIGAVFIRVSLAFNMVRKAYRKMVKGDMLPWMLLSFGFLLIAQGQWAQPTFLGFAVLTGGLIMACINKPEYSTYNI